RATSRTQVRRSRTPSSPSSRAGRPGTGTRPPAALSVAVARNPRGDSAGLAGTCAEGTDMRSTVTAQASSKARRASDSQTARALARTGLAARGVLYILVGWVAVLVAFGQTPGNQANQAGALQLLARQPLGLVLLCLLGIGFAGYALWRFSEVA